MLTHSKSTPPKNNRIWGGRRKKLKSSWEIKRNYAKVEKLREIMQIDENFLFDFNSPSPDIPLLTWLKGLATTFSSFWRKCFSVLLENETASLKSFWCHLSVLTTHGLQLDQNQSDLLFFLHGVDLLCSENTFDLLCLLCSIDPRSWLWPIMSNYCLIHKAALYCRQTRNTQVLG